MTKPLPRKIGFLAIILLISAEMLISQVSPVGFSNRTNLLLTDNYSGVCMAIADMNADGKDDIVRYNYGRILNIEYQTSPNQSFQHANEGAISNFSEWSNAIADVDGNGYNDILVGGKYTNLKLISNSGSGNFRSNNIPSSDIFTQSTNFVDINNDGAIDLFACNDDADNREYLNDGSGSFIYSPDAIDTKTSPASDNSGSYGSIWTDYDNDGDLDLYISKCKQGVNDPTDPRRLNMLMQNDGNNNFTEVAAAAGLKIGEQTWLTEFADIDNDGDLDAFVGNHYNDCKLLLNNGNGAFIDITDNSGLLPSLSADAGVFVIQAMFRDFNNDGYVDLIFSGSQHFIFYNNGDRTFTEENPFGNQQIESLALGDLNSDGFVDVYAGYAEFFTRPSGIKDALFMNNGNNNNFIAINLKGIESNINGIGARVEIFGDFGQQVREVRSGEGYGIMNSFTQHFGIGRSTSVSRIEIKWPSGNTQTITNPQINQFHYIIEKLPCAGQACDDGDPCTINDFNDDSCNCVGTLLDSDDDGVCDTDDVCPGYDDTIDSDNDGIPNGCDSCPNGNDNLIGQACNDNNPCTIGETYDNNCNCSGGTILDSDNDGVCNSEDKCPGSDDNLDDDGDGTPNGCDNCPNLNDSLIGQLCDDGNDCTVGERYTINCNCSGGTYTDADNDGYCIGDDSNDNDPCVPDASAGGCNSTDSDCEVLHYTGFENGNFGVWLDGGSGGKLLQDSNFSASGTQTFYIQGDLGANSTLYTQALNLEEYNSILLSFSIYPYSMETGDAFSVEIATSGGNYSTYKTYTTNIDFTNEQFLNLSLDITGIDLTSSTRLRFRAQTTETADYIMLDEIRISGCNSTSSACIVGGACNDGDDCTVDERYDSDCNCVGGRILDSDNDGICNAEDSCPTLNNNLIGQPCDDGDACTSGESYDNNCGCTGGTSIDLDQDGFCANQDPDDNDPCVPVASGVGCTTVTSADDCLLFSSTDFENGSMGIWIDGGSSARLVSGTNFSNSGDYSFYLQGNEGAQSSISTRAQDFSVVEALILDFNILPYSIEPGDSFVVEVSTNGSYSTYKTYRGGTDLVENVRKFIQLKIENIDFSATTFIRLRAIGNSSSDYFIFDDLNIETCTGSLGPNCTVGAPCNDGDSCTSGETYDSNCNCVGGTIQDSDNDGICNSEDICPGFNDNLIGQPCNDGNICTTGETYDSNCGCSGGVYTDNDNDGYCAGNDADDNDPCIPNVLASGCDQTTSEECITLSSTDFEGANMGIWKDGGNSARLFTGNSFSNSGNYSFYIQADNGSSSSLYSSAIDLSTYSSVKVGFHYYAYSVEGNDRFYLELDNGNGNYYVLKTYQHGREFENGDRVDVIETFNNINFSSNTSFRFRSASDDAADYFILDDIVIEGCDSGSNSDCQIGASCDDNNPCTLGETYDSNCNCTGGTVVDNDNDGYCAAIDTNDNDPCVPDNTNPNCNTTSSSLDCNFISQVGFENNQLGIWNDGGGSARILNSASFANSGNYLFYLQGNAGGQSSLYTDALELEGITTVRLSFNYFAYSLENGDSFFVEVSNGGDYFTYRTFRYDIDFVDNDRKDVVLEIDGINFSNNVSIRIRMGGDSVSDYLMLDDIKLETCIDNNVSTRSLKSEPITEEIDALVNSNFNIYPNPTSGLIYIEKTDSDESMRPTLLQIFDIQGRAIMTKVLEQHTEKIDLSNQPSNQVYLFRIIDEGRSSHSFKIFKN